MLTISLLDQTPSRVVPDMLHLVIKQILPL